MFTFGFVQFPFLGFVAPEHDSFFLEFEFSVELSLLDVEFIFFLSGFGISQVNLFNQLFGFYFVQVNFVHVVFKLLLQSIARTFGIQGFPPLVLDFHVFLFHGLFHFIDLLLQV